MDENPMNDDQKLTPAEQAEVTQRLTEWIRQERDRGIPMEAVLQACFECGILAVENQEEEEPPADPEAPLNRPGRMGFRRRRTGSRRGCAARRGACHAGRRRA